MQVNSFYSLFLAALLALILLDACQTPPSTPPTFVMAYTGSDSRVHMMQSTDGSVWSLPATAPGPNSSEGVSAAHDGTLSWMVMWNSAGSLNYITGVGGLPSASATQGVTWESTSNMIRTSAAAGTPAVAFANGKWVAVFLSSSGMKVVRSVLEASSANASDADLNFSASSSPALSFGGGKFVLAYLDEHRNLVSRTSSDGVSWTEPSNIFAHLDLGPPSDDNRSCVTPTGATLSFASGAFYAVSRQTTTLCAGDTGAGGSRIVAYRSTDGASWTMIVDRQSGPAVVREEAGIPGSAFAQCKLVFAYTQTRNGSPPTNVPNQLLTQTAQASPCDNSGSFAVGNAQTPNGASSARLDSVIAVAFGSKGGP